MEFNSTKEQDVLVENPVSILTVKKSMVGQLIPNAHKTYAKFIAYHFAWRENVGRPTKLEKKCDALEILTILRKYSWLNLATPIIHKKKKWRTKCSAEYWCVFDCNVTLCVFLLLYIVWKIMFMLKFWALAGCEFQHAMRIESCQKRKRYRIEK